MNAFLHGFGGGAMNIRVNAYADEAALLAAAPPDNTVGVLGTISGWHIVDKMPDTPEADVLYLLAGKNGAVDVAVAKNINLHLSAARRNGAAMAAWIYQDGAWTQFADSWDGYYFRDGEQYTDITGGWVNQGAGTASIGTKLSVLARHYTAGNEAAQVSTALAVDLTDVDTLFWDSPAGSGGYAYGGYLQVRSAGAVVREVSVAKAGQGSMDVSDLTGMYYLVLRAASGASGDGYADLRAIWRD